MSEQNLSSKSGEIEDVLARYYHTAEPSAAFAAQLRTRLRQAAVDRPARRALVLSPAFARAALSAALFLALVGLVVFSLRSRPLPAAGLDGTATLTSSATAETPATAAPRPTVTQTALPVPLVVSPRLCALNDPTATPDAANGDMPILGRRPEHALNSGSVRSGDFSFELLLYCSPQFTRLGAAFDMSEESEIEGLGIYAAYDYEGTQTMEGETAEISGFVPYVRYAGGGGPSFGPGSGGRQITGIRFPNEVLVDLSGEATPLRFIYKVQDPQGNSAGAALSFTLRRETDGYTAVDIRVEPLSAAELAMDDYSGEELPARDPGEIHPLLPELKALVERARAELIGQPGWVHTVSRVFNQDRPGTLPNGAAIPDNTITDSWYLLGTDERIETAISQYLYEDGRLNQLSVYQDGVWENRTLGFSSRSPNESLSNLAGGVYADAVRAARSGETLRREETEEGIQFTTENGQFRHVAVLDPVSGQTRWTESWQLKDGNWERFYRTETVVMERAEQPPADILALIDLPAQAYQPLPPEGTPAPTGFDPSDSKLRMVQIAGDDFTAPTFWYGDLFADEYLLGRVDFGVVPGGWCKRSADGARIAFQYMKSGDPETLRWLDLRDVAVVHEPLPEMGLQRLHSALAWSPDGHVLAFSACREGDDCRLYLLDTDSGELRQLARVSSPWPVLWKRDGSQVAIIEPDEASQGKVHELVVLKVADGEALYRGPANYPNFDAGAPVASWGVTFPPGADGWECE